MQKRRLPLVLVLLALVLPSTWSSAQKPKDKPYNPKIASASDEGKNVISRFQRDKSLKVELFAAEPMLANPVCFCIDNKGRFYVSETFRLHDGVTDIRRYMEWLDDDLACRTVEDRVAMMKKHLGKKIETWDDEHERVRLIVDTDGDGKADKSTVFADGFKNLADGIAAGLVTRKGTVWYTSIPDLWQLRDTNGDGRADERKSLSTGYGVHVGFLGHDLHGLTFGPDGKIYFSIGDRGINVKTKDRHLFYPDMGTVLRCNPDGSDLEVFAMGLRNPQELAFDDLGNFITVDNNSDGGDQARLVHLVDGGDSGWRIGYQFGSSLGNRGPWNAEKLWRPQPENQAAYLLPPLVNVADGPSGLVHYPGLGLADRYKGHFFLADFRGGSANSGIRSFGLEPNGASFKMVDQHQFLWLALPTDVDFGPDGSMYFTDWIEGWGKPNKGRIYKVTDPKNVQDAKRQQATQLFAEGFEKLSADKLSELLSHPHQRIRLAAQFELADRGSKSFETLQRVAVESDELLARVHAIWGLGQIHPTTPATVDVLLKLTEDENAEIRAQVARVLGDRKVTKGQSAITKLLGDGEPRVRMMAGLALNRVGTKDAIPALVQMLKDNGDQDPYLRHAAVMGLVGTDSPEAVLAYAQDASASVRLGVLLALRRWKNPEVARFLTDIDPRLVLEAARAINDVPIPEAFPKLAALTRRGGHPEHVFYRALNAHFRLGKAENALAVAKFATRNDVPESVRVEAIQQLGDWAKPSGRDRIVGLWRALPERPEKDAEQAFESALGGIFTGPNQVRQEGVKVAAKLGIKQVGPVLLEMTTNTDQPAQLRVQAMQALETLKNPDLPGIARSSLRDKEPEVRAEARSIYSKLRPQEAFPLLVRALEEGELVEQQKALTSLGALKADKVDPVLSDLMAKLLEDKLEGAVQLELLEAAKARSSKKIQEQLATFENKRKDGSALEKYRESLWGGDPEVGRQIFFTKSAVSCLRCHKVRGEGGEVGPDLSEVASKQKREYLLESIVEPSKEIAKGFESVTISTNDGQILTGILRSEDDKSITLMTAEGQKIVVAKEDVDARFAGKSAMPEDAIKHLSRRELRDLVAFLTTLQKQ